jgi:hypothetical protein
LPGFAETQRPASVMMGSVRKLFELNDDLKVHSDHAPEATIGRERGSNPFVKHALDGGSPD